MDEALIPAEGRLESSGEFTLSPTKAAEKLLAHLQLESFCVYTVILQWMVGLGCTRASVEFASGYCVVSGAFPQEDPFRDWHDHDLAAFLESPRPLDRLRGLWRLELSREGRPAWLELWEHGKPSRSVPLYDSPTVSRNAVTKPAIAAGSNVVVLFDYKSSGEDHVENTKSHLMRKFPFCPIDLKMPSSGFLFSVETDLRGISARAPVPLPLLFDAYANDSLGRGRGIVLRPPFAMSMGTIPVFAHWQNHDLMDLQRSSNDRPECSMARYFAKDSWQWSEKISIGRHDNEQTLLTGRGRIAIYCSGTEEGDTVVPVYYGAVMEELQGKLGLPGFRVVACADGLDTDLACLKLRDNESLSGWLEEIRETIRHFLKMAQDHPPEPCVVVARSVVDNGEAINLAALLTVFTLPISFGLHAIGPGVILCACYFIAAYQYGSKAGTNEASRWSSEQIRLFLENRMEARAAPLPPPQRPRATNS